MSTEIKGQALETVHNVAANTALGSLVLAAAGSIVVEVDLFARHFVQGVVLRDWLPERISSPHELLDVVGQYGVKGAAAGTVGLVGGGLIARFTDRHRGNSEENPQLLS